MTNTDGAKKPRIGRPKEDMRSAAFLEVARYLEENDDEQITINDLVDLMKQKLGDTEYEAYSHQHMQNSLEEHFGLKIKIIQTAINGKTNMVTFRTTGHQQRHKSPGSIEMPSSYLMVTKGQTRRT